MGFPLPVFFAWVAVLSEFFGGILIMIGLFTRPAALLNVFVTFTATFIYHDADIGGAGLLSFFFFVMCLCILLFGPGKFSMDYLINSKLDSRLLKISTTLILFLALNSNTDALHDSRPSINEQILGKDSSNVEFYLKNNSILPKKKTIIIYRPQQEGNNTLVKWILPFQKVRFNLPLESKVYLAKKSQVERVMQGMRIDDDEPCIWVSELINNATLPLNECQ